MKHHSFSQDVENPENKKAESIVFEVLQEQYPGYTVTDVSAQKLKWDFTVENGDFIARIDAKFDANIGRTNRLPLEIYDEYQGGAIRPTWGVNPSVDYVAVVPWTFTEVFLVPIASLTRYVVFKLITKGEEYLKDHEDWVHWTSWNPEGRYLTHGLAVPQARFEAFMNEYKHEDPVITFQTKKEHHRTLPRILFGGKEVA